jgi:hypothetical protein
MNDLELNLELSRQLHENMVKVLCASLRLQIGTRESIAACPASEEAIGKESLAALTRFEQMCEVIDETTPDFVSFDIECLLNFLDVVRPRVVEARDNLAKLRSIKRN